jgi:hypothetical protein
MFILCRILHRFAKKIKINTLSSRGFAIWEWDRHVEAIAWMWKTDRNVSYFFFIFFIESPPFFSGKISVSMTLSFCQANSWRRITIIFVWFWYDCGLTEKKRINLICEFEFWVSSHTTHTKKFVHSCEFINAFLINSKCDRVILSDRLNALSFSHSRWMLFFFCIRIC